MNDMQIKLARHALGLDGHRKQSYRNRFVTGSGSADHPAWLEMVSAGDAKMRDGKTLPFSGDDMFWLTKQGAEKALRKGECLCPKDFPS